MASEKFLFSIAFRFFKVSFYGSKLKFSEKYTVESTFECHFNANFFVRVAFDCIRVFQPITSFHSKITDVRNSENSLPACMYPGSLMFCTSLKVIVLIWDFVGLITWVYWFCRWSELHWIVDIRAKSWVLVGGETFALFERLNSATRLGSSLSDKQKWIIFSDSKKPQLQRESCLGCTRMKSTKNVW